MEQMLLWKSWYLFLVDKKCDNSFNYILQYSGPGPVSLQQMGEVGVWPGAGASSAMCASCAREPWSPPSGQWAASAGCPTPSYLALKCDILVDSFGNSNIFLLRYYYCSAACSHNIAITGCMRRISIADPYYRRSWNLWWIDTFYFLQDASTEY